ncbi:MAG: hypothetical protein WBA43_07250 [Elainellaceae cyanobacterium]
MQRAGDRGPVWCHLWGAIAFLSEDGMNLVAQSTVDTGAIQ